MFMWAGLSLVLNSDSFGIFKNTSKWTSFFKFPKKFLESLGEFLPDLKFYPAVLLLASVALPVNVFLTYTNTVVSTGIYIIGLKKSSKIFCSPLSQEWQPCMKILQVFHPLLFSIGIFVNSVQSAVYVIFSLYLTKMWRIFGAIHKGRPQKFGNL